MNQESVIDQIHNIHLVGRQAPKRPVGRARKKSAPRRRQSTAQLPQDTHTFPRSPPPVPRTPVPFANLPPPPQGQGRPPHPPNHSHGRPAPRKSPRFPLPTPSRAKSPVIFPGPPRLHAAHPAPAPPVPSVTPPIYPPPSPPTPPPFSSRVSPSSLYPLLASDGGRPVPPRLRLRLPRPPRAFQGTLARSRASSPRSASARVVRFAAVRDGMMN